MSPDITGKPSFLIGISIAGGKSICNVSGIEKELAVKIQQYSMLSNEGIYYKNLYEKYSEIKTENVIPEKENGYWRSLINHRSLKMKKS